MEQALEYIKKVKTAEIKGKSMNFIHEKIYIVFGGPVVFLMITIKL